MKNNNLISFEKVRKTKSHVDLLYNLLKLRKYKISSRAKVDFEEHQSFVLAHPYRVWYIVREGDVLIGSVYVKKDNSIGLNLIEGHEKHVKEILRIICESWKPLREIPSVRSPIFSVNVHIDNKNIQRELELSGHEPIQISYNI